MKIGNENTDINRASQRWKEYWLNADVVPSQREDTQIKYLMGILEKELDLESINNILEVGVGYGRVAEALLNYFHMRHFIQPKYIGLDISYETLKRSDQYIAIKVPGSNYNKCHADFEAEKIKLTGKFDLVISVETMSVVPYDVEFWIDKMVSLSNKYVVNLDFRNDNDVLTNCPPHPYEVYYNGNNRVVKLDRFGVPSRPAEEIFIARVC
jgi:SAM-dependent methyltransferase